MTRDALPLPFLLERWELGQPDQPVGAHDTSRSDDGLGCVMSYRLGPFDFDALDQAEGDLRRTNADVARLYMRNLYTLISKELAAESWREISVSGSSGSFSFSILASSSGSSGRRYWASQEIASADDASTLGADAAAPAIDDSAVLARSASSTLPLRVPPGKRTSALHRRLLQEHLANDPVRPARVTCKGTVELTGLQEESPALSVISRPRARSTPPRDGVAELHGGADLAALTDCPL